MQYLDPEQLESITQNENIEDTSVQKLFDMFRGEEGLQKYAPDGRCQIDPRDGTLIVYNAARAKRPHEDKAIELPQEFEEAACPVCQGKTTGSVDVQPLSEGYTFINKNLFPILYPPEQVEDTDLQGMAYHESMYMGRRSYGLHFLQWSSTYHDRDLHNLPFEDSLIVMNRLAALEEKLLFDPDRVMPQSHHLTSSKKTYGFVSIIKNFGKLVGGSMRHGHQQIAYTNIMPRRFYNDWRFSQRRGQYFSEFMLKRNPEALTIRDYGEAVLVVPYFMKRPYDMLLLLKDPNKQYLCELTEKEMRAVTNGVQDAIEGILKIMPRLGKDTAYNFTVNNGPGAGLYLEFLPYTQETGGFEHLGLYVCQDTPDNVVEHMTQALNELDEAAQREPCRN